MMVAVYIQLILLSTDDGMVRLKDADELFSSKASGQGFVEVLWIYADDET